MRYTEKSMRDLGHNIAFASEYGGDRFSVFDIEMMLDGISRADLEKIREYAVMKVLELTPGLNPDDVRKDIDGWIGPNIRCEGKRIAEVPVDAENLDSLRKLIEDTYGLHPSEWKRDLELEEKLCRSAQRDIDSVIDLAGRHLRTERGVRFSPVRFTKVLSFCLSGIETAEMHRVKVAHYAEDLGFELFKMDSLEEWPRHIADYLTANDWQIGDSLKEALDNLSRSAANGYAFPPLDMGLAGLTCERLAAEVRYRTCLNEEMLLSKPLTMADGQTYEWIGECDGVVSLWNEHDVKHLDNVSDVMTVDRVRGLLLDTGEDMRMKRNEEVARMVISWFGLCGDYVLDLNKAVTLQGIEVTGFAKLPDHEEDMSAIYHLVKKDGSISDGMDADGLVAFLRRSDYEEVSVIDRVLDVILDKVGDELQEAFGEELPPEKTVDISPQFLVRTADGSDAVIKAVHVDPLGGVSVSGMHDGGRDWSCGIAELDPKSIEKVSAVLVRGYGMKEDGAVQMKKNNPGIR